MSADNRICIMEWENEWYVWHGSLSCSYPQPPNNAMCFETEKEAYGYAENEAKQCQVLEGGISVIGLEEQKNALISKLKFNLERLYRLNKVGTQNYFAQNGQFIQCEIPESSNFKKIFELMEDIDKIIIYEN